MIRKAVSSDLEQLIALEKACFKSPWDEKQFHYEFNNNPYANMWVYEQDEKIVGYYDLWIMYEIAELANIAVLPAYQHQGIGHQLMDHVEQVAMDNMCDIISLEVRVSNLTAQKLYEKHGLIKINVKPGYYKDLDGYEDAYRMMKGI